MHVGLPSSVIHHGFDNRMIALTGVQPFYLIDQECVLLKVVPLGTESHEYRSTQGNRSALELIWYAECRAFAELPPYSPEGLPVLPAIWQIPVWAPIRTAYR